jgi:hypothetical protein
MKSWDLLSSLRIMVHPCPVPVPEVVSRKFAEAFHWFSRKAGLMSAWLLPCSVDSFKHLLAKTSRLVPAISFCPVSRTNSHGLKQASADPDIVI